MEFENFLQRARDVAEMALQSAMQFGSWRKEL